MLGDGGDPASVGVYTLKTSSCDAVLRVLRMRDISNFSDDFAVMSVTS